MMSTVCIRGKRIDLEKLKGMSKEDASKLIYETHPGISIQFYKENQSLMYSDETYYINAIRLLINSTTDKVLEVAYH